jgi:hypothetical protein
MISGGATGRSFNPRRSRDSSFMLDRDREIETYATFPGKDPREMCLAGSNAPSEFTLCHGILFEPADQSKSHVRILFLMKFMSRGMPCPPKCDVEVAL